MVDVIDIFKDINNTNINSLYIDIFDVMNSLNDKLYDLDHFYKNLFILLNHKNLMHCFKIQIIREEFLFNNNNINNNNMYSKFCDIVNTIITFDNIDINNTFLEHYHKKIIVNVFDNNVYNINNINRINKKLNKYHKNNMLQYSSTNKSINNKRQFNLYNQEYVPTNSNNKYIYDSKIKTFYYNTIEQLNGILCRVKPIDIIQYDYHNKYKYIDIINIINANIQKKYDNIIMIASKIKTENAALSYTNNRSIYTHAERFTQTLETIESVYKYIKGNNQVIMSDNSIFTDEELTHLCSRCIQIRTDNKIFNRCINYSKYKGQGEMCTIIPVLDYIKLNNIEYKNLYKISGRYFQNEQFDMTIWDTNYSILKKNENIQSREYYYTSFYKINVSDIQEYYDSIVKTIELYLTLENNNKYSKFVTDWLKKNQLTHINLKYNDLEYYLFCIFDKFILLNDIVGLTQIFSCEHIINNI